MANQGMATHTSTILLCILANILVKFTLGISQNELNYMARNLQINYTVINNIDQPETKLSITLKNTGPDDMTGTHWSLYFSNMHVLQPKDLLEDGGSYIRREGVLVGHSGLKLFHVNGVLFRFEATPECVPLLQGQELKLKLNSLYPEIARTDMFPNWYLVGPGLEPRIVDSTAGNDRDFVSPFIKKEQYKRSKADLYKPYTPSDRYKLYFDVQENIEDSLRIIPKVVKSNFGTEGMNIMDKDWAVVYNNSNFAAGYLAEKLELRVVNLHDNVPTSRLVELKVDASTGTTNTCSQNKETYTITIDTRNEKVTIQGREEVGVLHGVQSLLALTSRGSGTLYHGTIEDCPRFYYRGMHVDVARNFFPKTTILKTLDLMSMYKLNKFHFHLTDDEGWRLQIPDLPELTEIGGRRCHDPSGTQCLIPQLGSLPSGGGSGSGFYSVDDYREILQYAQDRFIKVIPEFDMPGHAHAAITAMLARKREHGDETYVLTDPNDVSRYLSVQAFIDNAINPCMNSTYVFVSKLIDEVIKMHSDIQPLDVFHFGGDEVAKTAWERSPACSEMTGQSTVNRETLKKYFVERISTIAQDRGLVLAGWEDGFMFDKSRNLPYNITDLAAHELHAYSWNNVWGSAKRAHSLANAGYKTVISHATHLYFDHPHEPDPEEKGYHWATRFINTQKVFNFMPDSLYDNVQVNYYGQRWSKAKICINASNCPELTRKENVIGIQGQFWGEAVRTSDRFEAMVYPRLLALGERAWHEASWEADTDATKRNAARQQDWELWAHLLGHKELLRLDELDVNYHILPPGAVMEGDTLKVRAEFPGLEISVSQDGGATWCQVKNSNRVIPNTTILLRTRSADGRRQSRVVHVVSDPASSAASGSVPYQHDVGLLLLLLLLLISYTGNMRPQ